MPRLHSYEYVKSYVEDNSTSKLIDKEYVNGDHKMHFQCSCGNEFVCDFNHFKRGRRVCTACAVEKQFLEKRLPMEEVIRRIEGKGLSYVSGEYINNRTRLRVRCGCGKEFSKSLENILTTPGMCSSCSRELVADRERNDLSLVKNFAANHGIKLISTKYENAHSKLVFECSCGRSFTRTWNNLSSGKFLMCRNCSKAESSGERRIREWLESKGISYISQKKFEDCGGKRSYPFDFYIPKENLCIEYDGEFHFMDLFGNLEKTKERDKVKTNYCKSKGMRLLRIPYTAKEQIETILSKLIPR